VQLASDRTDKTSLATLGADAVRLLCSGQVEALEARYGYALAFDRERATAIREDLASCLIEFGATKLVGLHEPVAEVKYFERNGSGLFALIECWVPTDNAKSVLIELVVMSDGKENHLTLEQISAAT